MPFDAPAETWFVRIGEAAYGPYSRDRLRAFVAEGRVRATTLVGRSEDGAFAPAGETPALAAIVNGEPAPRDASKAAPAPAAAPDASTATRSGETAHFVIVADVDPETERAIEGLLGALGRWERAARGAWMARATASAEEFRNTLSRVMGADDTLLIVDASRDRAAWFNIGHARDAALRALREDEEVDA